MEGASTEASLAEHSDLVKEGADHSTVVLFKKDITDADKPVPVVNLTPVRFIGGPTKQVIVGNIQGAWGSKILVYVVTIVGVPVEEALAEIFMKSSKVVIHLECDSKV